MVGVLLAQRAGRRIARVGKRRCRRPPPASCSARETPSWSCRPRRAPRRSSGTLRPFSFCGTSFERADIGGDVLALRAVAAGRGAYQLAALVAQRHRQAVDLRLGGQIGSCRRQASGSARCGSTKSSTSSSLKALPSDSIGNGWLHFPEAPGRRRADLLRRRFGRDEIRESAFRWPLNRWRSASYSASETLGASSW